MIAYLKKFPSRGIHFLVSAFNLHSDSRSHSGFLFTFGNDTNVIFSKSVKQREISCSSTEAELIALFEACRHLEWFLRLYNELDVNPVVTIYQDNKAVLSMIQSSFLQSNRSRFMNLKFNFIKEFLANHKLTITYLPTALMKADLLTKPVVGSLFQSLVNSILD